MASGYQAEFRFAIEQTGIVRRIERAIFPSEPEADGDLRAGEELAGVGGAVIRIESCTVPVMMIFTHRGTEVTENFHF
jgi:hypothetical protein